MLRGGEGALAAASMGQGSLHGGALISALETEWTSRVTLAPPWGPATRFLWCPAEQTDTPTRYKTHVQFSRPRSPSLSNSRSRCHRVASARVRPREEGSEGGISSFQGRAALDAEVQTLVELKLFALLQVRTLIRKSPTRTANCHPPHASAADPALVENSKCPISNAALAHIAPTFP